MTGPQPSHCLGVLADWLEARRDFRALTTRGVDAPEREIDEAASRVTRTFKAIGQLDPADVRRWATEAGVAELPEAERKAGRQ